MKSKLFMYLFFFALLFILYQYMNEKTIFESQEEKISTLTNRLTESDSVTDSLRDVIADFNYFSLTGNENAMTYFDNLGLDGAEVERTVTEAIYETNFGGDQNPLVPYESQDGKMRFNKVKFLNHRWVIADFTDGTYWGEVILDYFFDENNQLLLTPVSTVLYPN